ELLAGGDGDDSNGWFIQPTVFGNVAPDARIMQEEIFGPVVALSKVSSFDEAIEVANNTDYGLTGSVITNNRKHMEQARRDFFRSEEHTSELQSRFDLVCRLLLDTTKSE